MARKIIYIFLIILLFRPGVLLYAQQSIQNKVIPIDSPKTVNFKQLSDYERTHPRKKKRRVIEQGEEKERKIKLKKKHLPTDAKIFNIDFPHQRTDARLLSSQSPAPAISFNGTMDDGSTIPPDIEGAAGPLYLMETTNQEFDIFTKNGTAIAVVSPVTLFAATGGSSYFDPHVVYDSNYGRFLICSGGNLSNGHSGIFLAISKSDDPTESWYIYTFDGSGNSSDLIDFPLLGYNTNWVVITGNDYRTNDVVGKIFVFNRASIYNGSAGSVTAFTDDSSYSMSPAETYDASQTQEYLVEDYDGNLGGNGYMQISTISGTASAPIYTVTHTIGVNHTWYEYQDLTAGAPQKGSGSRLEDGDTRVGAGTVYINGSLWFAHTVFLPATIPTHDAVDWWQVNPVANTVTQYGRIEDPTATIFYYYPSINVNTVGDALLGYCESSSGLYVSSSYSFHASADAAGVMENTYIFQPGLASYFKDFGSGRNRWGDFTGTALDPNDNSFWNFSQWANTGNNWGTSIANVLAAGGISCLTPSGLATTNITDSSATFSWNAVTNDTIYYVEYHVLDDPTWTIVSTRNASYTVHGLTQTTQYEWRVQSLCTAHVNSSFTASIMFQTLTPCNVTAPAALPVNVCAGDSAVLHATGSDTIFWFASPNSNLSLAKGNNFTTPNLFSDTSYYTESIVTPALQHVGPPDSTFGSSSIFTSSNYHDEIFDCYAAFRLVSVKVYAQGAGNRIITLISAGGDTLASKTVSIADGMSRVTLNFNVAIGANLQLGVSGTVNLLRNSTGGSFPYVLPNVLSINGTNVAGLPGYYYYFYDWIIQRPSCSSPRAVVNVKVADPNAAFSFQTSGDSVVFSNHSTSATSWLWFFGDSPTDTSSKENPSHTYTANNTYSVTLVACSGSNCCNQVINQVPIIATSLSNGDTDNKINIYPNPIKNYISIFPGNIFQNTICMFTMTDVVGRLVLKEMLNVGASEKELSVNTTLLASGMYMLSIENKEHKFVQKIIKE